MTYPSSDVSTTDMDAGTDSPATARSSLLDLAQKFNELRNHVGTVMRTMLSATTPADARTAIGALGASDTIANATAGPGGTPFCFRNVLINSGFRINQRAYVSGAALAAGVYGHDRFKAGASGGDYTFTQLASTTPITIAAGKSLIQVVENKNVEGGSYVLSWTGTAQARYGVNTATPSGSYASSPILITGQNAGTVMSVEFNSGTLRLFQLEVGSVATPFEQLPLPMIKRQCARYLPIIENKTIGVITVGIGQVATGGIVTAYFPFAEETRIAPTGILYSALNALQLCDADMLASDTTAISLAVGGSYGGTLNMYCSLPLTRGYASTIKMRSGASIQFTGCEL